MQRVTSYTAAGKEPIGKRREDGGRKNLEGGWKTEGRMEYRRKNGRWGGTQNAEEGIQNAEKGIQNAERGWNTEEYGNGGGARFGRWPMYGLCTALHEPVRSL